MQRSCLSPPAALGLLVMATVAQAQPKTVRPRVVDEPVWSYPVAADRAGVHQGEARALVSISEQGRVVDFVLIGCTHRAFAEAVAEALPQYRFSPAKVRGEPATVRVPLSFYFKQEGRITSISTLDQLDIEISRLSRADEKYTSWLCPQDRLDRPLTPARTFSPRYPAEMIGRGERGTVKLDFIVDRAGKVRMPAVDDGAHPSFTREAVAALGAWEFEPPTSEGRPVIVHASQVFNFWPPAAKPSARDTTATNK